MRVALLVCVAVAALAPSAEGARKPKDPKECEVCIKVLEGVDKSLSKADKKNTERVEAALNKYCANKQLDRKQKKACYYMGPIQREVSKPFTMGLPPADICFRKLRNRNTELCEMRFPTKVEKGATDYSKMRMKQLRNILADRGVDCRGCIEKNDFVARAKETEDLEA